MTKYIVKATEAWEWEFEIEAESKEVLEERLEDEFTELCTTDDATNYENVWTIEEVKIMTTNYERIKAMSVEEMARFLSNKMDCCVCSAHELHKCKATVGVEQAECIKYQKQWLESEAENDR